MNQCSGSNDTKSAKARQKMVLSMHNAQCTLNKQPTTQATMPTTSHSNPTNHTKLSNLHSTPEQCHQNSWKYVPAINLLDKFAETTQPDPKRIHFSKPVFKYNFEACEDHNNSIRNSDPNVSYHKHSFNLHNQVQRINRDPLHYLPDSNFLKKHSEVIKPGLNSSTCPDLPIKRNVDCFPTTTIGKKC